MPYHAVICEVCDKVAKYDGTRGGLPENWRRITISNPTSFRKRGISSVVCGKPCAKKLIDTGWDAQLDFAA